MLQIKRLKDTAIMPARATDGSAGFDCCACLPAPVDIPPGACIPIPLGFAMRPPDGAFGALFPRSGLSLKNEIVLADGVQTTLGNTVGVADMDYRGEVMALLLNRGKQTFTVNPGMRVCQLILVAYMHCAAIEVLELDETARGAGGFGSTGLTA